MLLRKGFIGLAMLAGALTVSGAALAGPTATVDGVTIPVGISAGGFYIDSEQSYETLVTAPGQNFQGVFYVSSIGPSGGSPTWSYGNNSAYLTGVFQNFIVSSVTLPTTSSEGKILFTGGTIDYYVSGTDNFAANLGTVSADIAADTTSTVWLSAAPEVIDSSGDTLSITLPALTDPSQNGLTDFSGATALALLDVTGGDAAYNFNTGTFVNSYSGATADIQFHGTANSGGTGDFGVSGTNYIKANTVPEPLTISLFGAGLVGAATIRRRKSKKS